MRRGHQDINIIRAGFHEFHCSTRPCPASYPSSRCSARRPWIPPGVNRATRPLRIKLQRTFGRWLIAALNQRVQHRYRLESGDLEGHGVIAWLLLRQIDRQTFFVSGKVQLAVVPEKTHLGNVARDQRRALGQGMDRQVLVRPTEGERIEGIALGGERTFASP